MNINGATRASIQADMIRNMSRESLMEIAPAVEQLSELDLLQLPADRTNTEADRLLDQIRRVLSRYAPTGGSQSTRGVAGAWPQWVTDAQRASRQMVGNSVAPGQPTGNGGSFNLETGEFRTLGSVEERRLDRLQRMRESDRSMVNQLRDRINSLGGTGGMQASGNNVDESV
ncbi:MAG: hypothetical protein FWC20_09540 [Oscillospiraceae bacterium]|nr:hypothetical protein [Oscillospiraceae bacterium]MCL2279632.1 hypothetical protein [Oscillospiraceae bacterium]